MAGAGTEWGALMVRFSGAAERAPSLEIAGNRGCRVFCGAEIQNSIYQILITVWGMQFTNSNSLTPGARVPPPAGGGTRGNCSRVNCISLTMIKLGKPHFGFWSRRNRENLKHDFFVLPLRKPRKSIFLGFRRGNAKGGAKDPARRCWARTSCLWVHRLLA